MRRLERLHLKILKKKQSAVFNQTCLDNDLPPKCVYVCMCIYAHFKYCKILFPYTDYTIEFELVWVIFLITFDVDWNHNEKITMEVYNINADLI